MPTPSALSPEAELPLSLLMKRHSLFLFLYYDFYHFFLFLFLWISIFLLTFPIFSCMMWSEVKVVQSCLTLCNPTDYTVHRILQARILEWVAFPFSRGSSQLRDWTQVSHIAGGCFTSWATRAAHQLFSLVPFTCYVLSCSVVSDSLWPHGLQPARLLCPWDSPGRNTGVGCHALLQGIFPTQGLNPGLLLCTQILYRLSL